MRLFRGFDQRVGACRGDVDRFFREHVKAALSGGDALLGVESGRASDHDQVHRPVGQERFEVGDRPGRRIRGIAARRLQCSFRRWRRCSHDGIAGAARAWVSVMFPPPIRPMWVGIGP